MSGPGMKGSSAPVDKVTVTVHDRVSASNNQNGGDVGDVDGKAPEPRTDGPSFVASFVRTFPHAPIIFALTITCCVFVTFNNAHDFSTDINIAGAQRLRSQQVIITSLLWSQNLTSNRIPSGHDTLREMITHQSRLSSEYNIEGILELRELDRIYHQNLTNDSMWSMAVLGTASSFLEVADHNVAILEEEATAHSDRLYYIIVGLCGMEFVAIGALVYATPRKNWVDAIETARALKTAEAQQFEAKRKAWEAPAKAYQTITSILAHDLKGVSANGMINIDLLKDVMEESTSMESSFGSDQLTCKLVDALMSRIVVDNTHVQLAVSSVQMISNIANKVHQGPSNEEFDLGRLVNHLLAMYPTCVFQNTIPNAYFRGDEEGTYHVLHNAVRNAVKYGAVDAAVKIEISPCEVGTMISVYNLPGANHSKMCSLQNETGLQLMDWDADEVDLESLNVGSAASSYQGCRDMRNVVSFLGGTAQLTFLPDGTKFSLLLPGLNPAFQPGSSINSVDLSEVCVLCADDQNPPRLQIPSALEKLGINNMIQQRELSDVKNGMYRDEPKLKLFGRTIEEVAPDVWARVLDEWQGQPVLMILDQNICFSDKTVLGTDICLQLRTAGFDGIIAIRSGNESEHDKKIYREAGADALISKSINASQLACELKRLMVAASVRAKMSETAI